MASAEIVEREEERHRRFVILPLLAVPVRQASEAANLHSQRLVRTFNVARANPVFVRIAEPRSSDNVNYRSWTVTMVLRLAVDFHQGRVIHSPAQDRGNRRSIRRET